MLTGVDEGSDTFTYAMYNVVTRLLLGYLRDSRLGETEVRVRRLTGLVLIFQRNACAMAPRMFPLTLMKRYVPEGR